MDEPQANSPESQASFPSGTGAAAGPTTMPVDYPPGNHPNEVAARRGIGPLSPLSETIWHGQATPCVTCGLLVRRDAAACDYCGQDLSEAMLEKMRQHAGPWYVLEHVRPFPGVSLDRIIRQIRRGLIGETSIVRGPATDYQWRFAVETPGLCRYFGRCWHCHEEVAASDAYCPHCLSYLSFDQPRGPAAPGTQPDRPTSVAGSSRPSSGANPSSGGTASGSQQGGAWASTTAPSPSQPPPTSPPGGGPPSTPAPRPSAATQPAVRAGSGDSGQFSPGKSSRPQRPPSEELRELSAAVGQADLPTQEPIWDDPPRIGGIRATWVAVALLALVIVVLLFLTESRSGNTPPSSPVTPGLMGLWL